MKHPIKTFGLLALVAAAAAALFASAASATGTGTATVSAPGADTFHAVQNGKVSIAAPSVRLITCTIVTSTGSITNNAKTIEAVPNYDNNCHATAGNTTLPVTVTNEETCKFHFQLAGGTEGATGEWTAIANLTCSSPITIQIYSSHAAHTTGTRPCDYDIPTQSSLTGFRFRNLAGGKIAIKGVNVSLTTNKTFGTIANCGVNGHSIALYNGDTTATGAAGTLAIH